MIDRSQGRAKWAENQLNFCKFRYKCRHYHAKSSHSPQPPSPSRWPLHLNPPPPSLSRLDPLDPLFPSPSSPHPFPNPLSISYPPFHAPLPPFMACPLCYSNCCEACRGGQQGQVMLKGKLFRIVSCKIYKQYI
jgi:hypothetical protein